MRKLLTIAVMLMLGGCTVPQEQVLKKVPSASAQAVNPVNCTTNYRLTSSYTTCN